ncbi:MAG TPA: translation initiation factor 2 [Actinoplanes sp.]|nr:translation initiation factor 2 [Actinoplanes sp.]
MTTPTGVPDDAYWQRPDPSSAGATPEPAKPAPRPGTEYSGPPRTPPPSPHWRPPTIAQPPAPRSMPAQDMDALDDAEGSARTVTYGVGLVAGAIVLLLLCLLCARVLF